MKTLRAVAALLLLVLPSHGPWGADARDGSTLIRNATLVDPASGELVADQCIQIRGERIGRISRCEPGADVGEGIDASGNWIIPGLWDMHVHAVWDVSIIRDFFSDFVAYGVVGIRDMGGTTEALAEARRFLADTNNVGPELVAAGPVVDGPQPLHPSIAIRATSYEDGVRAVAELDANGADFIKIYTTLPADAAQGVFDEARARDLAVVGHLPASVSLSDALQSGMASIEHMAVDIGGLCDVADRDGCLRTFSAINEAGVYVTPTLLIRQRPGQMRDPQTLERSRIGEMPPVLAAEWRASLERNLQRRPDSYVDEKSAQYERERRLTGIAIEAGALILAGTDTGDFLVPPGSSIHEELELLVRAGMDENEALLAATARAADFLRLEDRGRIREGAIADLVILGGNPLEDIRNTRNIAAVILKGRVLDRARLECLRSRAC